MYMIHHSNNGRSSSLLKNAGLSLTHRTEGFSLIELLVALSILAVVAAIIIPRFMNVRAQASQATAAQNIRELQNMARQFVALGGQIGAASTGANHGSDVLAYLGVGCTSGSPQNGGKRATATAVGTATTNGVVDSTGAMGSFIIALSPNPTAQAAPAANDAAGFYYAPSGGTAWYSDGQGDSWIINFTPSAGAGTPGSGDITTTLSLNGTGAATVIVP